MVDSSRTNVSHLYASRSPTPYGTVPIITQLAPSFTAKACINEFVTTIGHYRYNLGRPFHSASRIFASIRARSRYKRKYVWRIQTTRYLWFFNWLDSDFRQHRRLCGNVRKNSLWSLPLRVTWLPVVSANTKQFSCVPINIGHGCCMRQLTRDEAHSCQSYSSKIPTPGSCALCCVLRFLHAACNELVSVIDGPIIYVILHLDSITIIMLFMQPTTASTSPWL